MTTFRDHFSSSSAGYARFRPGYPEALFDWIAAESPARGRVWDCATGTGQAASGLAQHFDLVVATDASAAQLAAARRHPRIRYVRSTSEAAGLASRSMDAITVAQAIHWFDMPRFFAEAARVGRPGALVAAWTYGNPTVDPAVDAVIVPFYRDVVGPYWPPERRMIERLYEDVDLPFTPVDAPPMEMSLAMTLEALAGYVDTWSAVVRYRGELGKDPLPALVDALRAVWGDPASSKVTRWPMAIRAGRV